MTANNEETNVEEPMIEKKNPKDIHSRAERPTGSVHFGDVDFDPDIVMDATWGEVIETCCVHTPQEWGYIFLGFLVIIFFLYFFLFGLELLGSAAKVMSGCSAGALFGDETNPIAALMVGILATVLLQSSSTTTSIVVSLIGPTISVNQGIYMIMGANIGTSVTNTIVAMGAMGDGDALERAFAGATVHDLFNFLTVAILLPVELITGYLSRITGEMVKNAETKDGESWEGPLDKIVSPLADRVIKSNKKVINAVAKGGSCDDFYPIKCEDGIVSASTCKVGLIACDSATDRCPAFFDQHASRYDDKIAGGVCFFIAVVILFICLAGLVTCLNKMLNGLSTRILYKATNVNGYIGIAIGLGVTMLVQSSSITTSALTPLVGAGALRLEQMLPMTLGANIGTTMTALLAALVTEGTGPLRVALAHLFFNITGIIIWYPIPFMRQIPLNGARALGRMTRLWRGFPLVYILVMFGLIPGIFLGLSALFETGNKGWVTLGSILVVILAGIIAYTGYWCHFKNGREKVATCFRERQRRREVMESLPDDMQYLKAKIEALVEHTGLPDDDEEAQEKAEEENATTVKQDTNSSEDGTSDNEVNV